MSGRNGSGWEAPSSSASSSFIMPLTPLQANAIVSKVTQSLSIHTTVFEKHSSRRHGEWWELLKGDLILKEQKHDTIDWAETLKVWNCRQLYVLREQIVTLA